MNMRIIFALCFLSGSLAAQTVDHNNELLWEITAPNGTKSYLFGSIHSNDKRLFKIADSVYTALHKVKVVALELDVSELYDIELDRDLYFNFDNEGEPYTNSPHASVTKYGNEDGMPQFLDAYMQQLAEINKKEIFPLETVAQQRAILAKNEFADFSEVRVENYLSSGDKMIQLYLKGDIYRMHDLMRNSLSLYQDLYERLIVERNAQMCEKLVPIMQEKSVFCTVGAGHLAGDKGMIRLLREKGFKLRKVTASFSENKTNDKSNVLKERKYNYQNDSLGIALAFPGKPAIEKREESDALLRAYYTELGQGNTYVLEVYARTFDSGLQDIADRFIASPEHSPSKHITLPNGGEAIEGLADAYPEGYSWTRILMTEDLFIVMKALGGNKFMNSPRPFRFFDELRLF